MSRRFINQLGERERIQQTFLAADKQLRANRNGNLYLQVRLSDRTGSVNGMMWNANDRVASLFDNGDFVQVQGTTQFYNGNLQIIISDIERAEPGAVHADDFIRLTHADVDGMLERLDAMLRSLRNPDLRQLAECFLDDEVLRDKLRQAPAAVKHHHAYQGGLLEHVVSLMEVVQLVAPHYPALDLDLLLMGAFLHDIGKIDELVYDRELAYSDEGQLIGHIVIAVGIVEQMTARAAAASGRPFPPELALRLKHMIVSHHGQYEFGSPKLPMTPEAVALHLLDNLDAKLHSFARLMDEDANLDSSWTPYHAGLGRKLFKGQATSPAAAGPFGGSHDASR